MIEQYKHILWDWNGTLLDDSWLCVEVLNDLLKEQGRDPISLETYRTHFNFPVIHFYEFLGFATDPVNFKAISHQFIAAYESRWLKECRLHAGVHSNFPRQPSPRHFAFDFIGSTPNGTGSRHRPFRLSKAILINY